MVLNEGIKDYAKHLTAKALLPISTLLPRLKLSKTAPLRILVDSSVRGHAITHETRRISTGKAKWGGQVEIDMGYLTRIPVHSPQNDTRVYREIRFLAGIAHLCRAGYLELYTSPELDAERFRKPVGLFEGFGWADYNVFKGIKWKHVEDGQHIDLEYAKEMQLKRVNACNDPIFLALLEKCGAKQSLDAYHIFTAHKHALDYYLHIDFRLRDTVQEYKGSNPFRSLKTQTMLPSEFAQTINLLPTDTNVLPLAEADTFFRTRADLHVERQWRSTGKPSK